MGKILVNENKYYFLLNNLIINIASLNTLLVKSSGIKSGQRKKKKKYSVSTLISFSSCRHDHTFFNTSIYRSLNFCITMLYLNFFKVVDSNAFVNRYVLIIIWTDLLNTNFAILLELMSVEGFRGNMFSFVTLYKSSLSYVIQATWSSCDLVALSLMGDSPHDSLICWIINFSHTHTHNLLHELWLFFNDLKGWLSLIV